VYVEPGAERALTAAEADRLRSLIRSGNEPVYVAVLPASVLQDVGLTANDLPGRIAKDVGLAGTYAVVVGSSFRATSTSLPSSQVARIATVAIQQHGSQGTAAVLDAFVRQVQAVRTGSSGGVPAPATGVPSKGRGSSTGLVVVAGLVVLVVAGFMLVGRGRRRREQVAVDETRSQLRAEAQALGDDVIALEPEVTIHPEARLDYDTGVSRYRAVDGSLDSLRTAAGADQVRRRLAEGRYSMSRARARIDGHEPPPPPAELAAPGPRGEPAVVVNDQGEADYEGHSGRWHGGGWVPGAIGGFLLGRMLGGFGGWGGGYGYGGGWGWGGGGWGDDDDRGGGGGWSGGGGGGGGGDWGGGGGGGGGGDVGGGDFG
jgi:hypothetical protein